MTQDNGSEWEKEFINRYCVKRPAQPIRWIRSIFFDDTDQIEKILDFITEVQTSRDTYWKERVRKEVYEVIQGRYAKEDFEADLDTLLDNLK